MKGKVENDLRLLYEAYGKILLQKQEVETELRVRQGILNLLAQEEQEKAEKQAEEEAEDAE